MPLLLCVGRGDHTPPYYFFPNGWLRRHVVMPPYNSSSPLDGLSVLLF